MDTQFYCGLCNTEYTRLPMGGYCDDSLSCALDEGEHLFAV